MYAQLFIFHLGPEMRSTAEKLAEQFAPVIKAQKGFKKITFFGDVAEGTYGSWSLWETKEDAEAEGEAVRPQFEQVVRDKGIFLIGPPTRKFFEVFEPPTQI